MASPHVVRDLSFAVSFASEELAIEEHNRLGSFLSGRLTAVVDEVFSQLSPGGGSVARIEKLEVDLGELPIASYYEDAETRLRERLEEALRLKLAGLGGASFGPGGAGARSGAASEGIVSAGQNELDLFVHFVETGHLPWNIHTLSRTMLDELLGRILAGQRTQLAARLRAVADKASAADRLAAQFSEGLLAGIADGFDANWEELAEEFRGWDGRPDWASLLLALMDGRSGQAPSRDWRALRRAVERAVETGDADPLRSFWAEMLAENPALLAEVVREVGASAEARRRMARGFAEPMLVAIAGVLEPGEIGFLEIAAGRLDSARSAAKAQGGNQAEDKAWFWEFTLTCLLAASGGGFERKAYVEGLCREIAARWGADYETARHAFAEVVGAAAGDLHRAASRPLAEPPAASEAMAANGGLRRAEQRAGLGDGPPAMGDAKDGGDYRNRVEFRSEALEPNGQAGLPQRERGQAVSGIEEAEVLEGLADGGASGPGPRSSPRSEVWSELWTAELETALATGDAAPIAGAWGAWMRGRRAEIARVVRGLGLDAHEVREIARNFPLPMLRDIAEALEPAEAQFVEYLCEQPVLSRGEAAEDAESGPVETRLLWELTLNYMLVERGSAFNRRSYLGSLARGMAGRHNLRYEDLVDSMIASLEQTPAPSAIGADLLAILGELRSGSALGGAADAASRDALKAARRSEGAQRSSRPGAEDGIDAPLRIDAAGLAGEFTRRFLPAEWAAGVDRAELLAEALRRFAFEKGASPEEIRKTLLAGLASSPAGDERPRQLLQLLRELRGESLLGPLRAEMRSLTVAEVMRSCELYDFFAERIRGAAGWVWVAAGQQAAASDPDLASDLDHASDLALGPELRLMLDELQRDYPWQLKRLAREAGMGDAKTREARTGEARTGGSQVEGPPAATAGPREGSLPDEDLRALAQALSGRSGRRRLPWFVPASGAAPFANGELEEFLVRWKGPGQLKSSGSLDGSSADVARLIGTLELLLAEPQEWFRGVLRRAVADEPLLRQLIGELPERQLARILFLSAGPGWHRLLAMADMIVAAAASGGNFGDADALRSLKWRTLFQLLKREGPLAANRGPNVSEVAALREFLTLLARELKARGGTDLRGVVVRELRRETSPSGAAGRRRILEALDTAKPRGAAATDRARRRPPARSSAEQARSAESAAEEEQGHIYILNAGQVLAAPYMPRLFEMTGLVAGNRFTDADAAERGAHLLQYLVDQSTGAPEHLLPLNKILCGLTPDAPIARDVDLRQAEKDAAEGLLEAMIAHWSALGKTSPSGLRESFLQREGRLRFAKGAWQLLVQPRAFDMLIDRLPWGFKVIKHPWMNDVVYVEWR